MFDSLSDRLMRRMPENYEQNIKRTNKCNVADRAAKSMDLLCIFCVLVHIALRFHFYGPIEPLIPQFLCFF